MCACQFVLLLITAVLIPLRLAFDYSEDSAIIAWGHFVDAAMIGDVVFNFFVGYHDHSGNIVEDYKSIAVNYLKGAVIAAVYPPAASFKAPCAVFWRGRGRIAAVSVTHGLTLVPYGNANAGLSARYRSLPACPSSLTRRAASSPLLRHCSYRLVHC